MIISQIVAVAANGVIGKDNDLIWRLPADLKFFKNTTMGHHMLMGRKNYESIGKPLPGRTTIIVTRDPEYQQEGCIVKQSIDDAIQYASDNNEEELMIIGGGQIYEQTLALTNRIYLTEVHQQFDGDTFYPSLNVDEWKETGRVFHAKDEKNAFDFSFVTLERV